MDEPFLSPETSCHMKTLYTFGYQNVKTAAQIKALAEKYDALVVDTRFSPRSWSPEFKQATLREVLGERYKYAGSLGNKNYKSGGEIVLVDALRGTNFVISILSFHSVILLCGCKDHTKCHRTYIAELIQSQWKCEVVHLQAQDVPQLP